MGFWFYSDIDEEENIVKVLLMKKRKWNTISVNWMN